MGEELLQVVVVMVVKGFFVGGSCCGLLVCFNLGSSNLEESLGKFQLS